MPSRGGFPNVQKSIEVFHYCLAHKPGFPPHHFAHYSKYVTSMDSVKGVHSLLPQNDISDLRLR